VFIYEIKNNRFIRIDYKRLKRNGILF